MTIHAPRAGSDLWKRQGHPQATISIHAPRAGSDSKNNQKVCLFLQQSNSFVKYHLTFSFTSKYISSFLYGLVMKCSAKLLTFPVCLHFAPKSSAHLRGYRILSSQNTQLPIDVNTEDTAGRNAFGKLLSGALTMTGVYKLLS